MSDLSEPENQYEDEAIELLEVYVAGADHRAERRCCSRRTSTTTGVAAAGRDVWLRFAPYWLGALVLLELLQVPLAISMARRLRRTQRRA